MKLLVTIDIGDREQVERLTAELANEYGIDAHADETRAALLRFALIGGAA